MSDPKPKQRGGRRPGAGRPPSDDPATGRLVARCTPELEARTEAAAAKHGMRIGAWLRQVIERAVRRSERA